MKQYVTPVSLLTLDPGRDFVGVRLPPLSVPLYRFAMTGTYSTHIRWWLSVSSFVARQGHFSQRTCLRPPSGGPLSCPEVPSRLNIDCALSVCPVLGQSSKLPNRSNPSQTVRPSLTATVLNLTSNSSSLQQILLRSLSHLYLNFLTSDNRSQNSGTSSNPPYAISRPDSVSFAPVSFPLSWLSKTSPPQTT